MFAVVVALIPCLVAPLPSEAAVVSGFRPPSCAWCPGHRGIDFAAASDSPVVAPVSGRVSFVGVVVGVRYVVIDDLDAHDGVSWKVTLGHLRTTAVVRGQRVRAGDRVGTAGDTLMLTVRRNGVYVDPAPLLATVRTRAHLVPTSGHLPRLFPTVHSCSARADG